MSVPPRAADRDAIRREVRTPIGIAEPINRAPFTVQVEGHAAGTGILDEVFEAPEFAAGDNGGGQRGALSPAFEATMRLQDFGPQ
jgi:hypothetical protein